MSSASDRNEKSLREEIQDLANYLAGLPDELKASGAFEPYEARMRELQEQLTMAESGASKATRR